MKLKIINILCIFVTIICMTACDSEVKAKDEKIDNGEKSTPEIMLSKYFYEIEFAEEEIECVIQDYNIEGLNNIDKLIYYPLTDGDLSKKRGKTKYIIDKLTEKETCKDVIYSSTFEASGGKAVIDRELITSNEFENKCDEKQLQLSLEKAYELDVPKEYKIKKEYYLEVEEGQKQTLKAYEIVKEYGYIVKNNNDKIGRGTLSKPIGILIAICEEEV